jgi:hypothetical protein
MAKVVAFALEAQERAKAAASWTRWRKLPRHTHTAHRIKQRVLETSQQGVWNIQYQMLNHFNIV